MVFDMGDDLVFEVLKNAVYGSAGRISEAAVGDRFHVRGKVFHEGDVFKCAVMIS